MSQALHIQAAREKKVMASLGYAGVIPFAVCVVAGILNIRFFDLQPSIVFCTYSVVIVTFLSGTVWGKSLYSDDNKLFYLLSSNIFTLIAWVCLLAAHLLIALFVLSLSYIALLMIEARQPNVMGRYYLLMRITLTSIVVLLHILMAFVA